MNDVVGYFLTACEPDHEVGECAHVRQHFFLRHVSRRTSRNLDHADIVAPANDLLLRRRVAARKDIDLVTQPGQLGSKMGYIDILSSTVNTAWRGKGRRMITHQGDFQHCRFLLSKRRRIRGRLSNYKLNKRYESFPAQRMSRHSPAAALPPCWHDTAGIGCDP